MIYERSILTKMADNFFEFNENDIETESSNGNVKISNDVVAAIAGVSAEETKGVARMYTSISGAIAEKFASKKNLSKGVKVDILPEGITLDLYIVVDYGTRIREVAEAVQANVKSNVESMTGMDIKAVNVHIEGVGFEKKAQNPDDVKIIDE